MAEQGVVLSESAAKRVRDAVLRVETMRPPQVPSVQHHNQESFWATIHGGDVSGRWFSWLQVYPDLRDPTDAPDVLSDLMVRRNSSRWRLADPVIYHKQDAIEANGTKNIPWGSIVRMHFAGYNSKNEPVFAFQFTPLIEDQPVPIHDHRDNWRGGGLAFSVMHPGTALPQQRFGV